MLDQAISLQFLFVTLASSLYSIPAILWSDSFVARVVCEPITLVIPGKIRPFYGARG